MKIGQQLGRFECIRDIGRQLGQNQHSARPLELAMNPDQFSDKRTRHAEHPVQKQHDLRSLMLLNQQIEVLPELFDVIPFGQLISIDGDNMDFAKVCNGEEG